MVKKTIMLLLLPAAIVYSVLNLMHKTGMSTEEIAEITNSAPSVTKHAEAVLEPSDDNTSTYIPTPEVSTSNDDALVQESGGVEDPHGSISISASLTASNQETRHRDRNRSAYNELELLEYSAVANESTPDLIHDDVPGEADELELEQVYVEPQFEIHSSTIRIKDGYIAIPFIGDVSGYDPYLCVEVYEWYQKKVDAYYKPRGLEYDPSINCSNPEFWWYMSANVSVLDGCNGGSCYGIAIACPLEILLDPYNKLTDYVVDLEGVGRRVCMDAGGSVIVEESYLDPETGQLIPVLRIDVLHDFASPPNFRLGWQDAVVWVPEERYEEIYQSLIIEPKVELNDMDESEGELAN